MKKIGLVGYGYWGRTLARCFNELGALKVIYELDPNRRDIAQRDYLGIPIVSMLDADFSFPGDLDAIAVATPPETHYDIALQALKAGKDVFIEKPMTTNYREALRLNDLAIERNLNLMIGHIYLHNGGIKLMPIPVGKAELYVQLLNEAGGPSPSTRDVLWAGLPHACSLALHFFPDEPEFIWASRNEDRIRVKLNYWNGSSAYLDVGDNTGRRLRRVELRIGETRYLFNTKEPTLCIMFSGILGKEWKENLPHAEPLMAECMEFLNYKGVDPMGPKVVKLIEDIANECKPKGN